MLTQKVIVFHRLGYYGIWNYNLVLDRHISLNAHPTFILSNYFYIGGSKESKGEV